MFLKWFFVLFVVVPRIFFFFYTALYRDINLLEILSVLE